MYAKQVRSFGDKTVNLNAKHPIRTSNPFTDSSHNRSTVVPALITQGVRNVCLTCTVIRLLRLPSCRRT